MLGRTVGALAALSLGATAILLPPGINKMSDSRSDALGLTVDPKSQAVKVHCSGCAFPAPQQESVQEKEKGDDNIVWIQGGAKDVLFNFTVDDNNKDLLLNGVKVYPVDTIAFDEPTVGQIHSSASLADIKNHPEQVTPLRVSSAGMKVHTEIISSANDRLVNINYQINELESHPMAVDGVRVKLLEGADATLIIISADPIPMEHLFDAIIAPASAAKECSVLPPALCKWKSVVENKISAFKPGMPHPFGGCGGRKPSHTLPGHIRPHFDKPAEPFNGEDRHHHGPHGMHRGPNHHRHHSFFPAFFHAFVAVLIPVMAGITMGMFVSLIGMLVGRLVSFLWIKFARGGQRGYASVAQSEQDSESAEKGVVIVEGVVEEESLPKYEDAPAYDEKDPQ